jgi:hypothetical protein
MGRIPLLATLATTAAALYAASDAVIQLTDDTFSKGSS